MNLIDKVFEKKVYVDVGRRYSKKLKGFVELSVKGRRVAAYVRRGDPTKKTIIYLHGNAEDLLSCGYGHTDGFERLGYTVAAVDYPGYGLSEGPFSEAGCYENTHALYEYLVADCGIRPENIAVIGCSLGSGVAVELASTARVGGLVLEVAFYSGAREAVYMADRVGLGGMQSALMGIGNFPSAARIRTVRCPVLPIHGTSDEIVPFEQGRDLYGEAPNQYGFVKVPGSGHCEYITRLGEERYASLITRFVEDAGSASA